MADLQRDTLKQLTDYKLKLQVSLIQSHSLHSLTHSSLFFSISFSHDYCFAFRFLPCPLRVLEASGRAGVPGTGVRPARRAMQETEGSAQRNGEVGGGTEDRTPPTTEGPSRCCKLYFIP